MCYTKSGGGGPAVWISGAPEVDMGTFGQGDEGTYERRWLEDYNASLPWWEDPIPIPEQASTDSPFSAAAGKHYSVYSPSYSPPEPGAPASSAADADDTKAPGGASVDDLNRLLNATPALKALGVGSAKDFVSYFPRSAGNYQGQVT